VQKERQTLTGEGKRRDREMDGGIKRIEITEKENFEIKPFASEVFPLLSMPEKSQKTIPSVRLELIVKWINDMFM
jgi:hypothetical protein